MHNFVLVNADTDSISFCKPDQSFFTEEERSNLLNEINALLPTKIRFEGDGYFKTVVVLKAKNYILDDGKKIKYKGSALKSSTLEPALKEFINKIIDAILQDRTNYTEIYHQYIKEINNITDIRRFCSKKTLSETTYKSDRANETKIIEAIRGSDYVEGDRIYCYFKPDENLALAENFDGCYNKDIYWGKLYKATERFSTIMDTKSLFPNYSLKKNKQKLEELLNNV